MSLYNNINRYSGETRICILTSTFPRYKDDYIGTFIYQLCKELAKQKNIKVFVLAPDYPGTAKKEITDSIQIRRFSYFYPRKFQKLCYGFGIQNNMRKYFIAKIQVLPFFIFQLYYLGKLIKRENISIINSHWIIFQGLTAAIINKIWKIPHILTIHAGALFILKRMPSSRQIAKFIVANSDKIFTVSSHIKDILKEFIGEETKATVLPMGVNIAQFAPRSNKNELKKKHRIDSQKCILYVGKLIEIKGVKYLVRSMKVITQKIKDISLIIIGDGPIRNKLEKEARESGVDKKIYFLGSMNHNQLADYYALCDLVVVPSIVDKYGKTEGMPVVILEAMAAGKPVIGSNVSGIPDMVKDGFNGFLVRPENPEDIAEKIMEIYNSKRLRQMSIAARRTALRYDWSIIAKKYAEVMAKLYPNPDITAD